MSGVFDISVLKAIMASAPPPQDPVQLVVSEGKAYLVKVPAFKFQPYQETVFKEVVESKTPVRLLTYHPGPSIPRLHLAFSFADDPLPKLPFRKCRSHPQLNHALKKYLAARKNYFQRRKSNRRRKYWFNVAIAWGDKCIALLRNEIAEINRQRR